MPLYEYKCTGCSRQFEKIRSLHQAGGKEICPFCGQGGAERIWSTFSAGQGSGAAAPSSGGNCGGSGGFT